MRHLKCSAGFTLLEVMVAIAISAVVAVLAYQGLSSAGAGAERSREILTQINELDRAWQIFAADMRHVLAPELGPTGGRFQFNAQRLGSGADVATRLVLIVRRHRISPWEISR